MSAALRSDWIRVVRNNLYEDTRNSRTDFVQEFLNRSVRPADCLTDKGLAFSLTLADKYKKGMHLCLPGVNGWLLSAEQFLGGDFQLGTFEDSMVLATMSIRDPSPVMALAALARLVPRATRQELVEEIVAGIGDRSRHDCVRGNVHRLSGGGRQDEVVAEVSRIIGEEINAIRAQGFEDLKSVLRQVMEGSLAPRDFVERFFDLSERCTIRPEIYGQMLINLMNSGKIRPLVKLTLLENVDRMPAKVRYQIYTTINGLRDDHENFYLKRELAFHLERERSPVPETVTQGPGMPIMYLFD